MLAQAKHASQMLHDDRPNIGEPKVRTKAKTSTYSSNVIIFAKSPPPVPHHDRSFTESGITPRLSHLRLKSE